MKVANHHDNQLTQSWDQEGFYEPWFGVLSNSKYETRIFTTLWPPYHGEYSDRVECQFIQNLNKNISFLQKHPLKKKNTSKNVHIKQALY